MPFTPQMESPQNNVLRMEKQWKLPEIVQFRSKMFIFLTRIGPTLKLHISYAKNVKNKKDNHSVMEIYRCWTVWILMWKRVNIWQLSGQVVQGKARWQLWFCVFMTLHRESYEWTGKTFVYSLPMMFDHKLVWSGLKRKCFLLYGNHSNFRCI